MLAMNATTKMLKVISFNLYIVIRFKLLLIYLRLYYLMRFVLSM